MLLEGSCHCGRVAFRLECREPWPYQRCYCGICRKTAGGGGYCINLGGNAHTLEVRGQQWVESYRACLEGEEGARESKHARHFCRKCGSHLWATHDDWPELAHPVAGAIDTELPAAPELVHMMVASRASWVPFAPGAERCFNAYPDQSLSEWHRRHGYEEEPA